MAKKTPFGTENGFTPFQPSSNHNGNGSGINVDDVQNLIGDAQVPSVIKELVDPGETPLKLLMRTCFRNERQVNSAVEYLSRCKATNDKEGEEKLLFKMAANVSIDGMARKEIVMALSQQIAPELYTSKKLAANRDAKDDRGP